LSYGSREVTVRVRLEDKASGAPLWSDLGPVVPVDVRRWASQWIPQMWNLQSQQPLYPDSHWDWSELIEDCYSQPNVYEGYHIYEETLLHALAQFKVSSATNSDFQPALSVEFLATAPWNRGHKGMRRNVGTVLIGYAVRRSRELGSHGRIGLHALPTSESFYEQTIGMSKRADFGHNTGLTWYEFNERQALEFYSRIESWYA
jgi:hypothetical protein